MLNFEIDTGMVIMAGTAVIVVTIVAVFLSVFFRGQKKDRFSKLLVEKTEGAQQRALSVILDAESRAMKDTGRDQKRPFDFLNWWSIKRDLKRAGLPRFPPLVFLFALVLSIGAAMLVLNMPIYPMWAQILAVYPPMFFLTRRSILDMRIESIRMRMMVQLIIFIESVQRAVSVGTSPDEAVAEAIRETEAPLKENLSAIKELIDLGYDFVDAINLAADKVNLPEFDIFAASLTAQSKTGGTIGEVLKEVIDISRSRVDLQKKIATMTGEGRFNAMLLGSLPILLTMYLRSAEPGYFASIWQAGTLGAILFLLTIAGAVFGAWLAMRIARITV
jgi:tight adherence protein B